MASAASRRARRHCRRWDRPSGACVVAFGLRSSLVASDRRSRRREQRDQGQCEREASHARLLDHLTLRRGDVREYFSVRAHMAVDGCASIVVLDFPHADPDALHRRRPPRSTRSPTRSARSASSRTRCRARSASPSPSPATRARSIPRTSSTCPASPRRCRSPSRGSWCRARPIRTTRVISVKTAARRVEARRRHLRRHRRAVRRRGARADAGGGARGQDAGATFLRGGAYKPRTSPYSFQGTKLDGLKILAEARAETGLPVVTEVIDTQHVEHGRRVRRRPADRHAQRAELRAARGGARRSASRCCSSAACRRRSRSS